MKLEDNVQICLTKSAILLRRGIKSQKEDEAMVLKIGWTSSLKLFNDVSKQFCFGYLVM